MTCRNIISGIEWEGILHQSTKIKIVCCYWLLRPSWEELGIFPHDGVSPWRDIELILRYRAPTKCPAASPLPSLFDSKDKGNLPVGR